MGLVEHAEREMRKAGLYDTDAGYGGMLPEAVMALVKAHSEQGHSGGSHYTVLGIFNQVVNFKPLTPISSDSTEWMEVGEDKRGTCFQNMRKSTCFSYDGGKTWYDIDKPLRFQWLRTKLRMRRFGK